MHQEQGCERGARHLPLLVNAHLSRGRMVEHAVHHLHLRIVVACPQRSHLRAMHTLNPKHTPAKALNTKP